MTFILLLLCAPIVVIYLWLNVVVVRLLTRAVRGVRKSTLPGASDRR